MMNFVLLLSLGCQGPTNLSSTGPNVMMIGDSISMGSSGYSLFVQQMLQTYTNGTLAGSVQHGGGFGNGGQMASSANGPEKVKQCIGNATGNLKPKAWSVITYNAGLHDCDTRERVHTDDYARNLEGIFETLKPAASSVVFVTTTPYDMPLVNGSIPPTPAGINMSCVVEYNYVARAVAQKVGGIIIEDLYGYVEEFCQHFNKDPASSGYGGNYTNCAIQTTGLHFFNTAPAPSGQQYTGISVAQSIVQSIPEHDISNVTAAEEEAAAAKLPTSVEAMPVEVGSCGNPPAPLSKTVPNVLIIGDSISEPGSGYGPGVENIFMQPGQPWRNQSGAIADVQHNGGATGSNQAGPSTNGAACIDGWLGAGNKWDVITMNFGIHDCCPGGDGRAAGVNVPLSDYLSNLGKIYQAASKALAPGGTIVWVTTTPHAEGGDVPNDCGITGAAFNTCIDTYNAAALKLMSVCSNVVVADLNSAVNAVCGKGYAACNLQRFHNVHFTTAGKQFCAVQVANVVAPLLAPKWAVLEPKQTEDSFAFV